MTYTPVAPANQFDNAETHVERERLAALQSVAQFGRDGVTRVLEAQKAAQSSLDAEAPKAKSLTASFGGSDAAQAEVAAAAAPAAIGNYPSLLKGTADLLTQEHAASDAVQSNYFKQIQQAIPLYRQNAQDIVTQYRTAYEERQAAIAHQAELERQRQAQVQAEIEAINAQRQAAAVAAAEQLEQIRALAAAAGSGGGPYWAPPPGPNIPEDTPAPAVAAPTNANDPNYAPPTWLLNSTPDVRNAWLAELAQQGVIPGTNRWGELTQKFPWAFGVKPTAPVLNTHTKGAAR